MESQFLFFYLTSFGVLYMYVRKLEKRLEQHLITNNEITNQQKPNSSIIKNDMPSWISRFRTKVRNPKSKNILDFEFYFGKNWHTLATICLKKNKIHIFSKVN